MILILIGLCISLYATRVHWLLARRKHYRPICDLSPNVSCSRALTSKEGSLFFLRNSTYGVVFYSALLVLEVLNLKQVIFPLAVLALFVSAWLAKLLYTQRNYCVVCIGSYVVNLLLVIVYWP